MTQSSLHIKIYQKGPETFNSLRLKNSKGILKNTFLQKNAFARRFQLDFVQARRENSWNNQKTYHSCSDLMRMFLFPGR